jgi:hypothetical protein
LHDVACALECGDADVECAALARADLESLGEFARRKRRARALELAQNLTAVLAAARLVALSARAAA